MYLIDTNIFLEILLEQEKAGECENFLENVEKSKESFYVSSFSIHSIEVILARKKQNQAISEFLSFLLNSRIMRIESTTKDELFVLEIAREKNLDLDDALQLYICQKHKLRIISYDKHFDKTSIERLEPSDITID